MSNIKKFFIIFFVVLASVCEGQNATWQRMYDNGMNTDDEGYDVCQSTDGNFYVIGFSRVPFTSIFVLKIKPSGDTIWTRLISPGGLGFAIAPSNDGGCIVTGAWGLPFTIKLNSIGEQVWYKTYRGTSGRILDLDKTSDNGYIGCGYLGSYGYILKIDSLGNKQWDTVNTNASVFTSIIEAIDTGYISLGITFNFNYLITKWDLKRKIVWEKNYSYTELGEIPITLEKANDFYLLFGSFFKERDFLRQMSFTKLNLRGEITASKVIRNEFDEIYYAANVINDNKYVFSSFYQPSVFEDSTICYFRIVDSLGNILHEKKLKDLQGRFYLAQSILPLSNGNIFFAGYAELFPSSLNTDIFAIITDSNLYVKPVSVVNNDLFLYDFKLFQNYPNPFNPTTTISYSLPRAGLINITVYDITGKEVARLVNEFKEAGSYDVTFTASNLSSGIYFYSLRADGFTNTKKMLVIK